MKPFTVSPITHVASIARGVSQAAVVTALVTCSLVATGSDLWLYSGRDFTGASARISRSEGNLPIGAARSIRVGTGVWEACTGANFTGECRRLTPGDYRELGGRYSDSVLSARDVTYGYESGSGAVGYAPPRLQLYEAPGFRGRTMALEQSSANLEGSWGLTNASSAIVSGGTWEVCTEYNYGGRCQALPPGQYNDLGAQLNYRIVSARALDVNQPTIAPPPPPPPPPVQASIGPFTLSLPLSLPLPQAQAPVAVAPPPRPIQPSSWNADRMRVEVYTETDFRGAAWTLDGDVDNLRNSSFNDRIRSMRIYGGNWEACEDSNYGGICMAFGPGDYRRLPPQMDRSISSLRKIVSEPSWSGITPSGQNYVVMEPNAQRSRHPVWLYEHSNFAGRTMRATGDVNDLANSGMNDATSSIFISFGTWQFCEDANYRGRCVSFGPGQYNEMPPGMNDTISSFRRVR